MAVLFDVRIDPISTQQLQDRFSDWLDQQTGHLVFTPNPEFLLYAKAHPGFKELLNESDLSLADGVGLRFAAAALTSDRLPIRQTGIDALQMLAALCAKKTKRLVLLGGDPDVASSAAAKLSQDHRTLDAIGIEAGYVSGGYASVSIQTWLLEQLQELKPDVLAVALGQGKQERFCVEALALVPSIKIAIGVGGAFDVISGRLKRAPSWLIRLRFEWIWRLIIQPSRTPRIMKASIVFPLYVVWDTLKHHRFLKAFAAVMKELFL